MPYIAGMTHEITRRHTRCRCRARRGIVIHPLGHHLERAMPHRTFIIPSKIVTIVRMAAFVTIAAIVASILWQPRAAATAAPEATFTRDVAPILQAKCVACHRAGEVAPMALLTYEDARPRARAIKAKVVARQMPPWF